MSMTLHNCFHSSSSNIRSLCLTAFVIFGGLVCLLFSRMRLSRRECLCSTQFYDNRPTSCRCRSLAIHDPCLSRIFVLFLVTLWSHAPQGLELTPFVRGHVPWTPFGCRAARPRKRWSNICKDVWSQWILQWTSLRSSKVLQIPWFCFPPNGLTDKRRCGGLNLIPVPVVCTGNDVETTGTEL